MANNRHVGIAEMIISTSADDILIAPNLGSCLGVAVFDPVAKIGGLIHCLLPLSKSDPEKAQKQPYMYVDTGVTNMLTLLLQKGAQKERLQIIAAGAGQINDANGVFNIGSKNHTVFRKVMWKNNLLIGKEHVGGNLSRTFSLHIASGQVWVKTGGENIQLK